MKPNTLRQTAAQWYDGQNSALYAYSSTGTILPGLAAEIKVCLFFSKGKEYAELARLYATIAPVPAINELEGKRFWHRSLIDSRGFPMKCHASGKLKTWKTRPNDFQLPVKYGIRQCFYITPSNVKDWVIEP